LGALSGPGAGVVLAGCSCVPADWVWELCWWTPFELPALLVADDELLWLAPSPCVLVATGVCVAVTEEVAAWPVEALWTVDWDWPGLELPPIWVWVLLWLVELSLLAEDEALFELDCPGAAPSSASAGWTCASPAAADTVQVSRTREHRRGRIAPRSAIPTSKGRPQVSVFDPPTRRGRSTMLDVGARVLLVEPSRILRQGIRAELAADDAEIVAEVATGTEAIAAAGELDPDVVVLDAKLPDARTAEVIEALTAGHPSVRVIVLAEQVDEASVGAVIESGARAYLLKDADDLDLGGAIARVLSGESVLDPRAAAALIDSRRRADDSNLSRQELKVLRLVSEGLTNPEIGKRLYLSRHTVKEYLSHAMRKLGAANRIEAVRRAMELGLLGGVAPGVREDAPQAVGGLVYDESGTGARSSELKVKPLKLDQLQALRPDDYSR
jgi:DNA-binding NarL/FixJ family response regulator